MPRTTETSTEVNQYRNKETDETVGAYAGTEQDKVYARDADYEVIGDRTPPPEQEGVEDATPHSGKTKSEGGRTHPTDLDGLSRDELNKLAADEGIENPEGFANKAEVTKAIEEAAGTASEPGGEE